jgi:hypothetical protein
LDVEKSRDRSAECVLLVKLIEKRHNLQRFNIRRRPNEGHYLPPVLLCFCVPFFLGFLFRELRVLRSSRLLVFWARFLHAYHLSFRSYSLTLTPFLSAVLPILQLLSRFKLYLGLADTVNGCAVVNPPGVLSDDGSVDVAALLLALMWLSNQVASFERVICLIGVAYIPSLRRLAAFGGVGRAEPGPSRSSATPM